MKTTRQQAAKELNDIFNSYEVRQNKLSTTYRKIWFDKDSQTWRLIGRAHNYTF